MRLLLDTHIAIWALVAPKRLSATGRALIDDVANEIFVSAASIWEIAIKYQLAKQGAPPFSGTAALGYFAAAGYEFLDVGAQHAAFVETLAPHHSDPFDRLLVAQAHIESMQLLTHDAKLAAYGGMVVSV